MKGDARERQRSYAVPHAALTTREESVIRCIAQGDTNTEAARRLGIAENTLKEHIKHILEKLGAKNRAHAVYLWIIRKATAIADVRV